MEMTWGTKPIIEGFGPITNVVMGDGSLNNPTLRIWAANNRGDIVQFIGGSGPSVQKIYAGNGTPSVIAFSGGKLFSALNGALHGLAGTNDLTISYFESSWTPFAVPTKGNSIGFTPKLVSANSDLGGPLYLNFPIGTVQSSGGAPGTWQQITPSVNTPNGPGNAKMFVSDGTLYAIAPDDTVLAYSEGTTWTKIRDQATSTIIAGGGLLCAIDKNSQNIFKYNGTGQSWTQIGGPGKMFAVGSGGELYCLVPNGSEVVRWNGEPGSWTVVGPTAAGSIYSGGGVLCATSPDNTAIWCYQPVADVLTLKKAG
jgi:hypothetical protein